MIVGLGEVTLPFTAFTLAEMKEESLCVTVVSSVSFVLNLSVEALILRSFTISSFKSVLSARRFSVNLVCVRYCSSNAFRRVDSFTSSASLARSCEVRSSRNRVAVVDYSVIPNF